MAVDTDKIKRNIEKMLAQGAPESDVDEYIAAEGVTADQLRASALPQAPQAGGPNIAADLAKSAGIGVAEGGISLAGMPGDIRSMYSGATDFIGSKLGASPQSIDRFKNIAQQVGQVIPGVNAVASGPSSADIKSKVEEHTGKFYEPQSQAGKYARAIGQNAVSAAVPGGLPMRAASVVVPALAGEAAGQATEGTKAEPLARIAAALAAGGATGAVPAMVHARRSLVPGFSGPTSRMLEGTLTPGAEARLAELGPDAFLFEGSPAARELAQHIATRPGPAMNHLVDSVGRRNTSANARLTGELDSALGPAVSPTRIEQSLEQERNALQPLYAQVTNLNEPVQLQHIYDQLRTAIPQQSGETQSALRRVLDMIAPVIGEDTSRGIRGQRLVRTNPREVLDVRQELDQMLGRLGESPKAHRAVSEYRRLVDEALGEAIPDVKIVDRAFADRMRESEALTRGSQIFDTGKTALRPEDLIRERQGMTLPQREAMRHGARAELDRHVGLRANDVEALKKVVMADGDWSRAKLGEIFGAAEAERIFRAVDREAAFKESYQKLVHNSATAQRQQAGRFFEEQEGKSKNNLRDTTLTGLALQTGKRAVGLVRDVMTSGKVQAVEHEVAQALGRQGVSRDDLLRQIRNAQSRRKPGNNMTRDILVRALMSAQAARN
jgi:hypothetical protein